MSIDVNNLISIDPTSLAEGQRVVIIDGVAHVSGVGGATPPGNGGGESDPDSGECITIVNGFHLGIPVVEDAEYDNPSTELIGDYTRLGSNDTIPEWVSAYRFGDTALYKNVSNDTYAICVDDEGADEGYYKFGYYDNDSHEFLCKLVLGDWSITLVNDDIVEGEQAGYLPFDGDGGMDCTATVTPLTGPPSAGGSGDYTKQDVIKYCLIFD